MDGDSPEPRDSPPPGCKPPGRKPFHAVVYSFLHKDSLNTPYTYFVFKKLVMIPPVIPAQQAFSSVSSWPVHFFGPAVSCEQTLKAGSAYVFLLCSYAYDNILKLVQSVLPVFLLRSAPAGLDYQYPLFGNATVIEIQQSDLVNLWQG